MKENTPKPIRCAIYTRKSTEENLRLEFNSLDAQRESGEAYIRSQASEGWICLSDRYDDGGYSGGNTDRPALQRLLADIADGRIDCVVCYKVDRISRALIDFAKIIEIFNQHGVAFVSVTQAFNTSTSAGRLMLNMLLSFAQFERELVSERTRDKIAASRRKGKWTGGPPPLGYDILSDRSGSRLAVNEEEANQVRRAFAIYLEKGSLIPTVQALAAEGITTKQWTTKDGKPRGGIPIDKTSLHAILNNVIYLGRIKHHEEVFEGEHQAIIDPGIWKLIKAQLQQNTVTDGSRRRNRYGATLKGILYCGTCKAKMQHHYTKKRNVLFRYYVCSKAQKHGWSSCATKSIPAREIEQFVLNEIRAMGCNAGLEHAVPTSDQAMMPPTDFDSGWAALTPCEQSDLIQLLVQRVEYDGPAGTIEITFHPHASQLLQEEVGKPTTEVAA